MSAPSPSGRRWPEGPDEGLCMRVNCLQNPFAILQHLVVPEAKHLPALARQISVTDIVAKAFGVLRTVGFDDQLSANAKKVDNVGSDRDLPAKLESAQATIAQEDATGAVRCRSALRASLERGSVGSLRRLRQSSSVIHRRRSPHPSRLRRATFSPREKGFPRRSSAHPFSTRRKGARAAVQRTPSPSGRRWPAKPVG